MAQLFHPATNVFSKVSIFGAVFLIAAVGFVAATWTRSSYATRVGVARTQPIEFSHEHHVAGLGIDCRHCHESVEKSRFAGMPSTQVCMGCHSMIWTESPMLEPVRESFRTGKPIAWTRVHDIPDFAHFDHHVHVHAGIGCASCHGRVDKMPLMWRSQTLYMEWCLECHRQPERFIRPKSEVFVMDWSPPVDQLAQGTELVKDYHVSSQTNCSNCHW